jgi:hypothetical protein
MTLWQLFGLSVFHEVLCVAYTISIAERRIVLGSTLSGIIVVMKMSIVVGIVKGEDQMSGILVSAAAHVVAAYVTMRWMPQKKKEQ